MPDVTTTLVHEWLTNLAGSEKVVAAMRRAFPGAPVVTSLRFRPAFPDWDPVVTSFLQPLARSERAHVPLLPAMPAAFRTVAVPNADRVVTSFHSFALHARIPPGARHLVYCHTPPRFLWRTDTLAGERWRAGLARGAGAVGRRGDRRRAQRPDLWLANSRAVAERILGAYGRTAAVVHPPVDVERFAAALGTPEDDYFLVLSRLVPYKRVDLAVAAFALLGWPLVVAGPGREASRLQASAPPNVRFVGRVDDADLPALLAGARALVFPGEEDFGLVPVEAMAAGTPVVAYGSGGVLDTVEDGHSGVFFTEPTPAALAAAVRTAAATEWDRAAIAASVRRFSEDRFRAELLDATASMGPA